MNEHKSLPFSNASYSKIIGKTLNRLQIISLKQQNTLIDTEIFFVFNYYKAIFQLTGNLILRK